MLPHPKLFGLLLLFVSWDSVSLCNPDCPVTQFIDQAGFKFNREPPASPSWMLGLKVCTTTIFWNVLSDCISYFSYIKVRLLKPPQTMPPTGDQAFSIWDCGGCVIHTTTVTDWWTKRFSLFLEPFRFLDRQTPCIMLVLLKMTVASAIATGAFLLFLF